MAVATGRVPPVLRALYAGLNLRVRYDRHLHELVVNDRDASRGGRTVSTTVSIGIDGEGKSWYSETLRS